MQNAKQEKGGFLVLSRKMTAVEETPSPSAPPPPPSTSLSPRAMWKEEEGSTKSCTYVYTSLVAPAAAAVVIHLPPSFLSSSSARRPPLPPCSTSAQGIPFLPPDDADGSRKKTFSLFHLRPMLQTCEQVGRRDDLGGGGENVPQA